jgi:hypothetical protein
MIMNGKSKIKNNAYSNGIRRSSRSLKIKKRLFLEIQRQNS